MSDIERRIARSAPAPTRPLDLAQVWRQAQRRRHRRLSAITAGAASLVLLAGVGLAVTDPGMPQPVVDAPDEQPPPPPEDATPDDLADDAQDAHDEEPDDEGPGGGRDEADVDPDDGQSPDRSDVDGPQPADQLAGHEFVATEVRDQDRSYALAEDTWLHLAFVGDPGELQVRWHAGCHEHRAPVVVTEQRLEIGELTRVEEQDCPPAVEEQEQWLQGLLTAWPRWQLEGSQLQLRAGEAIVVLEQGPPPEAGDAAGDPPPGAAVEPLAKAEGFRDDLEVEDVGGALLEIAYDRQTAERAWEQNVPDDLPEREGRPAEPGRYGDLDRVDFDRQALVVWHAWENSCPHWLDDVHTDDAGDVHVEIDTTAAEGEFCQDVGLPYRMVLAVDRDRLPAPDHLPRDSPQDDPRGDVHVTAYR